MRMITVLVALLCSVLPASAQSQVSKVYSNADVGKPAVTWTRTVTPEEWQGIVAREFRLPLAVPDEARAFVIPSSRGNDVLPALPPSASAYADRLWTDPFLAFQLQHPIEAAFGLTPFLFGSNGHHARHPVEAPLRPSMSAISAPLARPSVTTTAGGRGKPASGAR